MQLVGQNWEEMATYRGSKMSAADLRMFREGEVYRLPTYVATSKEKRTALAFAKHYLHEFRIPKGCMNVGYLEPKTQIKGEEEVLLPPYTAVRILHIAEDQAPDQGVAMVFEVVLDKQTVEESVGAMVADMGTMPCAGVAGSGLAAAAGGKGYHGVFGMPGGAMGLMGIHAVHAVKHFSACGGLVGITKGSQALVESHTTKCSD